MNDDEFLAYTEKLIKEKAITAENLTASQLATAMIQAIECGDFTRLVRLDNQAQQVLYIPFAREQELRWKIAELERGEFACKKCGLRKDDDWEPGDF